MPDFLSINMGSASRNKGANGERELSNILRDFYGYETKRGMVFLGQSDIIGLPGIHIECKRVEKLNIHNAMEQAKEEAEKKKDGVPTVFHRRNRTQWLVTMQLEDWMDLYGAWDDSERKSTKVHERTRIDHNNGSVSQAERDKACRNVKTVED